ncbi:PSD1 and planctomycete cytochrome C domain-containing protein [Haloferula sp. BvORR071]|uniref:PSD1 and planctomycete cytochrome C domain-containing protein n=1 Tax=Haloferula sp. BvORR071 TaxID=1396141 RepID=UPI000697F7FE|nr:PSD1 and planctomycete cytochrome C domain-containing protein [Haloferula sp. BvORR071]
MKFRILIAAGGALLGIEATKAEAPQFNRDVRPILSDKCFYCHGFDPNHRKADFRLDTPEGAQCLTDSKKAGIKPGSAVDSEAWRRILSDDPEEVMPPPESHKTLSAAEKEVLRQWIDAGAPYEKHWSFVPPQRPAVPPSGEANPIDAFLAARLKREGLERSPEAGKETLLRRVTLDLTGLPPSVEEMDAFIADRAAGAYERVVDRLLDSPRYGEKMASQWLDLARYGDTNGYLHDILRTGWPWRDWVIRAFNEDMPFDRFVIEQIAGDLLPNATPEQVLATAFCRNHLITAEGGTIAEEYLNEYAADRVQTVGTAFMGLTMNCCRCHDHKFDPLKQDDFYSLKAYFNSTTEKHVENNSSAAYAPFIEIASPLVPQGPKAQVMVMQEAAAAVPAFVLTRGQYDQPDKSRPVTRRPPEVLGAPLPDAPANRLGLAQWLVSERNPLLARVTVNRLWQQFFSTGIVKSADDFGLQGEYPVHPELLDWLAIEFREGSGDAKPWSTRHLVRQIVTSASYRQSSRLRPEVTAKDPDNRLLAFFPRRRLAAEEVRDQALFAAGLMSGELGGAPVFPYQPPGLWEERSNGGSNTKVYVQSKGQALYRRSLYTFWKRTSPPPFMTIFDAPERTSCSVRRQATNTPLQALAAFNDEQILECSRQLAATILSDPRPSPERLALLYRRVTGRSGAAQDLKTLEEGLNLLVERFRSTPADAAELLKQGAAPVDPALNPSELAAWMLVASTVFNLDQTLVRD